MTRCSRCAGPALLSVRVGPDAEAVLCAGCDVDHPTAGPVVTWFAVHGEITDAADLDAVAELVHPWIETVGPPVLDGAALRAALEAWTRPVTTSGGLMCDFCEEAVPRWAYRAGPAVSVPAGDWFACDGCRPYVDAREWSALAVVVGGAGDRTDSWEAFADAQVRSARPWPPKARIYRWP